jgi:hypothetical protein
MQYARQIMKKAASLHLIARSQKPITLSLRGHQVPKEFLRDLKSLQIVDAIRETLLEISMKAHALDQGPRKAFGRLKVSR